MLRRLTAKRRVTSRVHHWFQMRRESQHKSDLMTPFEIQCGCWRVRHPREIEASHLRLSFKMRSAAGDVAYGVRYYEAPATSVAGVAG